MSSSDVTYCTGKGCLIAKACVWYRVPKNSDYLSFFAKPPFVIKKKIFKCKTFVQK